MNIYDYKVAGRDGKEVSLSMYKGKVLLICNTATRCGFTPTYKDLEALYEKYESQGFEILDFPCNQFASQAPEAIEDINSFCVLNYGTSFPRFAKVEVNGEQVSPLFKYLKSQKGFQGFDKGHKLTKILIDINSKDNPSWEKDPSIKWNFTKFLISKKGEVVARFEPTASFEKIASAIEKELAK